MPTSTVKLKMRNTKGKRIEFTNLFNRKRKVAPLEIKIAFREALELFLNDPDDRILRNHTLTGKYAGVKSIDVTDDWRALYQEEPKKLVFVNLGIHKDLYN